MAEETVYSDSADREENGAPRGRGRGRSRRDDSDRRSRDRDSAPAGDLEPDTMIATGRKATKYAQPVREVGEDELNPTIVELTTGMLMRAGFPCRCEVKDDEYRQVRVITGDDSAGMLIGRHGSTVDAVEHLVERMMGIAAGDRVKMNLDINNYRRRREDTLAERVAEAVERVRETERDYHVEPMCARERRLVHLAAEEYEGIRTYTLMRSGDKHVVIALDRGDDDEGDGSIEPQAEAATAVVTTGVAMDVSAGTPDEAVEEAGIDADGDPDIDVEIVEMEPVDEDLLVESGERIDDEAEAAPETPVVVEATVMMDVSIDDSPETAEDETAEQEDDDGEDSEPRN
jgi:spoIIIJ-associated protein